MRIIRFFALLISLFAVASCAYNDIDAPSVTPAGNDAVTVCGRITSFGDHYVDTRAGKTNEESYSSSMAMAIFPIEGGVLGNCISYVHLQGSNVNFTVDRAKLRETYGKQYDNKPFALYLFANMPELPDNMTELEEKELNTLESLMQFAYRNTSIRRPQKGFPMVGSLGDNITPGADGNEFILIPTTGEEPNIRLKLPLLNGSPSDYIPIPLKALYAKFSFIITVDPEQHIQNGAAPTFTLENYTLKNVPDWVYADSDSNRAIPSLNGAITTSVGTSVTEGGELKFDFYLPERFLTPTTSAEDFPYPLGEGRTEVYGYSNVRDEDKKYCQRFKPDLVTPAQKATYITLNGHYSDHQGHNWKVTYDIYLGEDNYSDFNFRRNMNYINNVVIRGIKAYNHDTNAGPYIDHRVSVEGTLPIIINLQRETLLDSHFEVRPLRVRHPKGAPVGATVTVEILDSLGNSYSKDNDRFPNWVRMEHNNGAGYATSTHLASGKRWYFTFDLVTNTLNIASGKLSKVTLNNTNQETFWIYVDQCDEGAPLNNPNQVRKAKIKVTYDADGDPVTENEELVYTLCQHLLYPVRTIRNGAGEDGSTVIYYIEYEEEYLHNFDSEDTYGNTEYAGIEWGLNGIQLSHLHNAIHVKAKTQTGWGSLIGEDVEALCNNALISNNITPKYDFYLSRDTDNANLTKRDFSGLTFNQEIADFLRTTYESHQEVTSSKDAKIERISLDEEPKSAFAYCYNRNKRKSDGTIYSQDWYLPAIDEIEDIMEFAYGDFDTEFQNNMYWSCQPAYTAIDIEFDYWEKGSIFGDFKQYEDITGVYYIDDIKHARATKANRVNGTFDKVPSSASNTYGKQYGVLRVTSSLLNIPPEYTHGEQVKYDSDPYDGHPANMARKGIKARVRCVRKTEGVTVKNN